MTAVNSNLVGFRPNTSKEKFAYSGSGQYTTQRVDDVSQATKVESVTAETLTLSAGAAGVTGKVRTTYGPIMDSTGGKLGYYNTATDSDTSVTITHLALAGDAIRFDEYLNDTELYALLGNGDYTIDYTHAIIYYKKGTADTAGTIDYKYSTQEIDLSESDIQIGSVELKDADSTALANIKAANTDRTTATVVVATQNIDATGKVSPAGEAVGNAPFSKITDGTDTLDVLVQDSAFGTTSKGLGVFGKYEATPTTYTDGDAAPILLDANGRIVLSSDIEIGAVELKNGTDDSRARIGTKATVAYGDNALSVYDMSDPVCMSAEYGSPYDFTATYTSSTSITITGASFTVDDSSCFIVGIVFKPTGGTTWTKLVNGHNGVGMVAASGVITVSGYGTPFASGDSYRVAINYQKKAYDVSTDTIKVIDQSPDRASYVQDSLIDTTNVAAATGYYPSDTGMSMDGFKDMSLTGKLIEGDAVTDTISVEATNDEDTTNADWIQVYGLRTDTNASSNLITTAGVAGTYTFAWDFDNFNYSYFRVKLITADSTNTVIIKCRRKSL